ncbi:hypothetical protein X777_14241 [Ooceraea biroi]|nr:hypothetical protein X777_14241 [Ooceraea biroi]
MDYHRKRMNEYLCHGYMAEEIFKEVSTPRVKRRPESQPTNSLDNFLGNDNVTIHDKLLADEGSSKYKNWLQRTTMLDDVYRHYAPHKKMKKKQDVQHDDDIEEFDGEITGYAMQAPLPSGKVGFYEPSPEDDMLSSSGHHTFHYGPAFGHQHGDFGHHGDFFPSIHEEYYYAPQHHDHHDEDYHKPSYFKGKGHDLSIRDFFEIALTALAFLAFGLFIIQLLMNTTNNNPPMMMASTGRQRFKRHAIPLPLSTPSNEDLNDLSYRVLRSIEAAMVAEADSGNCLRRMLCEDNRYSKRANDGRRIWVPVWSLGMSWLSGKVLHKNPWSAMLDSVKASILGLGGVDCASFYPGCDLEKERTKRRRRRRK